MVTTGIMHSRTLEHLLFSKVRLLL
jgi:hypothetical protein